MEQQRVNLRLIKIESITLKERGKNEKFFMPQTQWLATQSNYP